MAMRAGNPYTDPQPHPKAAKHRRKKGKAFSGNTAVGLIGVTLLVILAVICWNGVKHSLAFLTDDRFVASVFDTTPAKVSGESGEAPVLYGVHDLTVYCGDTISYKKGITATDESDPNPTITVDNSAVDLSRPGKYRVIYTAADASGNITQAAATVTVLEKGDGFVDLETVYAAADAKLAEIIRENATVKQQVHDIYAWARLNLRYGGHSDRTDWRQTAYGMLTEGKGDCYGFYAVTKLLFERLGIPNIDVRKVRNYADDSDHFWSLVSLDEGKTWYHFDATPRTGAGDDFCLVTDQFLDAYSQTHDGSHTRDKSLYPKTP